MECRKGCAACCIHIHISSPLPGYPGGKAPEVVCRNLDENRLCRVWGTPDYPRVCREFTPTLEFCGNTYEEARDRLRNLERLTAPDRS